MLGKPKQKTSDKIKNFYSLIKPIMGFIILALILLIARALLLISQFKEPNYEEQYVEDKNTYTYSDTIIDYDYDGGNAVFYFNGYKGIKINNNPNETYVFEKVNDNDFCKFIIRNAASDFVWEDFGVDVAETAVIFYENNRYLVFDEIYNNDYHMTHIFSIKDGIKHIDSIEASIENIGVDNDNILLTGYFKLDILGSYLGYNSYIFNNKFEVDGEIYGLAYSDRHTKLTTAKELTVILTDGSELELPIGTVIEPIAINQNEKEFSVLLADKRIARFYYDFLIEEHGEKNKWESKTITVNGVPETEMFEFLPYAG